MGTQKPFAPPPGENTWRKLPDPHFLAAIVESSDDAIVTKTLQGIITSWNRAAERMFGYPAPEAIGQSITIIIPPDRLAEEDMVLSRIRRGEGVDHFETVRVTKTGQRLDISLTISPVKNADGQIVGASKIARDITDRKRVEARLREQTRILDLAHVLIRDPVNRILFWNTGAEKLYGYTAAEAKGRVSHDLLRTAFPVSLETIEAILQTMGEWEGELIHTAKDGRQIVVASHQVVHRDGQGAPLAILEVNNDITARKQMEGALREVQATLEQRVIDRTAMLMTTVQGLRSEIQRRTEAEAQLRRMSAELTLTEQRERQRLAQVLHDGLQQLLAAARLRAELLQRERPAPGAAKELSTILEQSVAVCRSLTTELSPPVLLSGGLIPALEWLSRWMAETHQLTVDLHAEPIPQPENEAVKTLAFQAVRELLFNVVKHAGVRRAEVAVRRADADLQVTVGDQGQGFEAGRANSAITGGLGLAGLRQRLAFLGGDLEIISGPGQGTRVVITVPIRPEMKNGEVCRVSPLRGEPIRVLVAEDYAVLREGLVRILSHAPDIQIVGQAASGPAAVELARQLRPDVIIMDFHLPELNGAEATRRILAEVPSVKIIGLSVSGTGESIQAALQEAGAVGFVSKSDPPDAVLTAIRACESKPPFQAAA
jgi:PAS domain S-box-containing protein